MGRHGQRQGGIRRGAHRSEPENVGALRRFGGLIESTVPKRVEPPRLLNVLVVSGVILGLLLFGYSTTQIYLQFGGTPGGTTQGPQDGAGPSGDISPSPETASQAPQTQAGAEPTTVAYRIVESTDAGFTGHVTVTNTSRSRLDAWELALAFEDAEVTDVRDADWETIEDGILARQPGGGDGLEPGESATLTFQALGVPQSPVRCSLNGHICRL
ncbi:cellulose binding domain-containing protein [Nocardiopsis lambiniae]|uniref:Cellulose binding domain-containing protein n=1 Tax=Nocardiopsis lambiniae TaxID=3075539 RepID=A0ABU2M5D1_9ACTN|nr:cellulose binding domain-containing protein [Nocardiopsis sp. DSM 44743]MDT0327822.1 cellulose binding domain-containing protein [Nocardiopsis sp. DSM 44743]